MFSLFGKKDKKSAVNPQGGIPPHLLELRKTLYTDASLDPFLARVKVDGKPEFPLSIFFDANQSLKSGDKTKAIAQLKQIVETQGMETRVYLQAWHTLMSLGEQPPESTRGVIQGVVIEFLMDKGLDIVAAYRDYRARYYNFSGAGVVWETRDPEIDKLIDDLMNVGQAIMKNIGAEPRPSPDVPPPGNLRIFLVAYDGSCFGQGLYEQLIKDQMGNYAINTGYNLMTGLMKKQTGK